MYFLTSPDIANTLTSFGKLYKSKVQSPKYSLEIFMKFLVLVEEKRHSRNGSPVSDESMAYTISESLH